MSIFSQHSRRSGRPFDSAQGRGFTLIELVVVGAIIIIVTSLFLTRQSKFDSSTVLRSLAYSIALSLRQAQVYGISVSGTGTASSNCSNGSYANQTCYAPAYGLYFSAASPNIYILFADFINDGKYSPGEDVQAFTLNNVYKISELCAISGVKNCSGVDDQSGSPIGALWVLFRRPNPDACIATDLSPNVCGPGAIQSFGGDYIKITSSGAPTLRSVTVSNTGAIVTQPPDTLP